MLNWQKDMIAAALACCLFIAPSLITLPKPITIGIYVLGCIVTLYRPYSYYRASKNK